MLCLLFTSSGGCLIESTLRLIWYLAAVLFQSVIACFWMEVNIGRPPCCFFSSPIAQFWLLFITHWCSSLGSFFFLQNIFNVTVAELLCALYIIVFGHFFFLLELHRAYVAALYTSNFTQFSKWCVKLCGFIMLENVLNVTCFISLNNKVFPFSKGGKQGLVCCTSSGLQHHRAKYLF